MTRPTSCSRRSYEHSHPCQQMHAHASQHTRISAYALIGMPVYAVRGCLHTHVSICIHRHTRMSIGTAAPRRHRGASALPTYVCMHMHSQASLHQRAHLPRVVMPDQDEGDKRRHAQQRRVAAPPPFLRPRPRAAGSTSGLHERGGREESVVGLTPELTAHVHAQAPLALSCIAESRALGRRRQAAAPASIVACVLPHHQIHPLLRRPPRRPLRRGVPIGTRMRVEDRGAEGGNGVQAASHAVRARRHTATPLGAPLPSAIVGITVVGSYILAQPPARRPCVIEGHVTPPLPPPLPRRACMLVRRCRRRASTGRRGRVTTGRR